MTKYEDIEKSVEVLDKYFPKGDSRRGDAMVVCAIARMEGREEMREIILNNVKGVKEE